MPFSIRMFHSEEKPEFIITNLTPIHYWKQNFVSMYLGTYILDLFKNKPHIVEDLKSNITNKIGAIPTAMPSATFAIMKHHVQIICIWVEITRSIF